MVHETLQSKAYRSIRDRLLSGVDAQGSRISDYALAKELGISRAPIREALNRLVSERLLAQEAGLGIFVPSPTRREIEDLYQVRQWLEVSACEAGLERLDAEAIQQMEQSCEVIRTMATELEQAGGVLQSGAPFRRLNDADAAFHFAILRATGNDLVLDLVRSNRMLEQLWSFYLRPHTATVLHSVCDEHLAILEALKAGDAARGCEALRRHLQSAERSTLTVFDQQHQD